jgi:fluoride exporter
MWREPVAISLGAISGALIRYYFNLWFVKNFGNNIPYGTLFINLTGCLVMGYFSTLFLEKIVNISIKIKLLVAVGFLGSYTTFSTYGLDVYLLIQKRHFAVALFYWLGSAVLGVCSIYLGAIIARFMR